MIECAEMPIVRDIPRSLAVIWSRRFINSMQYSDVAISFSVQRLDEKMCRVSMSVEAATVIGIDPTTMIRAPYACVEYC
jgi:hypothetical protein